MRALDTNALARYLAADEPRQLALAETLIEECRQSRESLFLPILVLCELVWVLARCYGQSKTAIVRVLDQILQMDQFVIENDALVRRCLDQYRRGKATFPDYVIGETSRKAGCRDTVTFDRALKSAPGFTLLA